MLHKGKIALNIKRGQKFKDATHMGIMRWELYGRIKDMYDNVSMTYGYITKNTRIRSELPKTHAMDALCVSGNPLAIRSDVYIIKLSRRHNRQIHKANPKKGVRKLNQAPRYVHGFQLFDRIKYQGLEGFIFGRRSSGYFDIRTLSGEVLHRSASHKKLKLLQKQNGILVERRRAG